MGQATSEFESVPTKEIKETPTKTENSQLLANAKVTPVAPVAPIFDLQDPRSPHFKRTPIQNLKRKLSELQNAVIANEKPQDLPWDATFTLQIIKETTTEHEELVQSAKKIKLSETAITEPSISEPQTQKESTSPAKNSQINTPTTLYVSSKLIYLNKENLSPLLSASGKKKTRSPFLTASAKKRKAIPNLEYPTKLTQSPSKMLLKAESTTLTDQDEIWKIMNYEVSMIKPRNLFNNA